MPLFKCDIIRYNIKYIWEYARRQTNGCIFNLNGMYCVFNRNFHCWPWIWMGLQRRRRKENQIIFKFERPAQIEHDAVDRLWSAAFFRDVRRNFSSTLRIFAHDSQPSTGLQVDDANPAPHFATFCKIPGRCCESSSIFRNLSEISLPTLRILMHISQPSTRFRVNVANPASYIVTLLRFPWQCCELKEVSN